MREAVIIDACRSPIGRGGDRGVFRALAPRDLMVPVLQAIVQRNKLDTNLIEDIVLGTAAGRSSMRMIALLAGLPQSVGATNTERQCASSTQAIAIAARTIINDDADVVIAAGLEMMIREGPVPPTQVGKRGYGSNRPAGPQEEETVEYPPGWKQAKILPRLPQEIPPWIGNMGMTAEELCRRWHYERPELDRFSVESHRKAIAAQDAGYFKTDIIPIKINYTDGTSEVIDTDQCPRRDTTYEKISSLPPAYKEGGIITAGNSCPTNDGAGAVLMMSKEKAKELGYKPLLTFRHALSVGVDPTVMGIGPVPSTKKLLTRTGMKISDFDIIEVNEAFAVVVTHFIKELGLGPKEIAKINPWGGAVAIGHPLGMTGTRQIGVIARYLNRFGGRWGLATLCAGGGQGMCSVYEREDYNW